MNYYLIFDEAKLTLMVENIMMWQDNNVVLAIDVFSWQTEDYAETYIDMAISIHMHILKSSLTD